MADTNWKLEGDTAQPRTLYLEHRDIYTYIYIHIKSPNATQIPQWRVLFFYTTKLERNQISMSRYLIIKSHF